MADKRPPLESFLKSPIQKEDLEPEISAERVIRKLRGPKGDKGDPGKDAIPPTIEELEALIIPLVPDPIPGKNGKNGERGERGFVGEKGDPGESIEVDEIEALVLGLIPDAPEELAPREVIEKINVSRGTKIKRTRVEGLEELENRLAGNARQIQNVLSLGGSRQTAIKVGGALLGTGINTINFIGATGSKIGDGSEVNITTSGGTGTVNSIVAGTGISVDSTDPANPIVTNTGSAPTFVENEIVSGSGTTFTLANTPIALSVHVFANGQRLTLGAGNDYTISGSVITTANSWSAGSIVADYRK